MAKQYSDRDKKNADQKEVPPRVVISYFKE